MAQPAFAEPISRFLDRCRDAVQWRVNVLRRRLLETRAPWKAKPVIEQLVRLKTANPHRPFCAILLIEHIGDIVACEPVVGQLRMLHPTAFVVWIVKPEYAALLASHPGLDAIVLVDSLLTLERVTESHVFDVEVDLHVNAKPTEAPDHRYQKRSGDPTIDAQTYIGKGSLLRSFSLGAGIEPRSAPPRIYVPSEAVSAVDALSLPDHFVVVHATPNYGAKDWSASNWRELVRHILDRYETHVIEIGLESVIGLDHPRFTSLCGRLTIIETAELIRRSTFFIGVDSGPAHMANAWRRPALLLFGRFSGSDTFNPFDGYYGEAADTVILRYPGLLRDQPAGKVIEALEASPMWRETLGPRVSVGDAASVADLPLRPTLGS